MGPSDAARDTNLGPLRGWLRWYARRAMRVPVNAYGRYAHIDAMRALSVLLVVLGHIGLKVPSASGVTIFFSISGFIICYLVMKEIKAFGNFSYVNFYKRRILKIFPPLVIAIILPSLVWASLGNPLNFEAFLEQIFFLYNWEAIGTEQGVFPGTLVVWSLSVEEQFYIAFALLCLWVVRGSWQLRLTFLAVSTFVWSFGARVYFALTTSAIENVDSIGVRRIYYGTDTRIDGIALGILTAILLFRSENDCQLSVTWVNRLGSTWGLVFAAILFVLSEKIREPIFWNTAHYTMQSAAACLAILYGFGSSSRLKHIVMRLAALRPVQLVGLASYSIYLVHAPAIYISDAAGIPESRIAHLIVALGSGLLLYYAVERPIMQYRKRGS